MPIQVDHDARRAELARVVARLIATHGLDAVTVRSTARAAGFSTRVVSHYFAGKRELLLYCYRYIARRAETRLTEAVKACEGDLAKAMNSLLPYNDEAREDWRVWVSFWGAAIADPEFSDVQRYQFKVEQRLIQTLLEESPNVRPAGRKDTAQAARQILTSLIGMAVQAAFNPDDWPRARQQAFMKRAIAGSFSANGL